MIDYGLKEQIFRKPKTKQIKLHMLKTALPFLLMALSLPCFAIDGILVQTIDYTVRQKWLCTNSPSVAIIPTTDTVFPGQTLYVTAIACDYQVDKKGCADVVYSVRVLSPDKSVYTVIDSLPLIRGKVQDPRLFQMSNAFVNLSFEGNDPLGTYQIELLIIDKTANTTKRLESQMVLTNLPSYERYLVTEDDNFEQRIYHYYLNPHPERITADYLYAYQKYENDENALIPLLGFTVEVFQHNRFLHQQLFENQKDTFAINLLVYCLGIENPRFDQSMEEEVRFVMDALRATLFPERKGIITDPVQLDILWAKFMASGGYEPVKILIQTLDYAKYKGSFKKVKWADDLDKIPEKKIQNAINEMIYNALTWSMRSNCEQHPLVLQYCQWALKNEKMSGLQRKELKKVLSSVASN